MVLNFHSLIRLYEDSEFFGCSLSKITAFSFENELGKIKKWIKSGYKPIQQVCKKLSLHFLINNEKVCIPPLIQILSYTRSKSGEKIIKSIKYHEITLKNKSPDNCVLLKNGKFILIDKINVLSKNSDLNESNISLSGKELSIVDSAFKKPIDSKALNTFSVKNVLPATLNVLLKEVETKAIFLRIFECPEDEEKLYVIPMLHM